MALGSRGWRVRPLRDGFFVADEEVVEVTGDEASGGGLLADDADNVVAVEVAGFAEEALFAVVVVGVTEVEVPGDAAVGPDGVFGGAYCHVLGVAERPAGEGAGGFFDVILGVVADAHAEELEQFASPIFVDCAVVVLLVVKPDNHGWVFGEVDEQVVELAEAEPSEHVYLVEE